MTNDRRLHLLVSGFTMRVMDQVAVNLGAPPTQLARLREKQRELAELEERGALSAEDRATRLEASQTAERRLNSVLDADDVADSVVVHALSEFYAARRALNEPDAEAERLEQPIARLRTEIDTLKKQIRNGT